MTAPYGSHNIVGSEADEPRPMAYMRSGRRSSTLSARGEVFVLLVTLIAFIAATAATLTN